MNLGNRIAAWLDQRALARIKRRASSPILRDTARDLGMARHTAGAWDMALDAWTRDA